MDKKKLKNNIQGVIVGISLTLAGINILDSAGYNINLVHPMKNVISSKEDDDCKNDEIIEEKIYIKNSEQLNEYIKNKPTFSEIREAIEENDNLSNDDKTKLLYVIDRVQLKIPFIDTRALYENCTSLKITRNKDEGNKHSSGSFYSSEKRINLKEDSDHVFCHEVLHMTNCLSFYDKKGNHIDKHFYAGNNDYRFLSEGFNEWLTLYLFNFGNNRYKIENTDIWIYQYICKFSDIDLINVFIEKNYSDIFSHINLSDKEKKELVTISKKIFDYKFDKTKEDITADEFVKKYKLLLKACLNTKNNKSYSYIYEIEKLLYDSYSKYRKKFPNEVSALKEIIHNEVVEKMKNENDIKIDNKQGEAITYSNFDNLYLIYNDIGTGRFKYIIGEKYFFHGKKQYHVDKDNFTEEFVNDTLLYDENYNPKVISIKKLINQYGDGRKQYTYEDICNMHKNSMKKKVKKLNKVKGE